MQGVDQHSAKVLLFMQEHPSKFSDSLIRVPEPFYFNVHLKLHRPPNSLYIRLFFVISVVSIFFLIDHRNEI